jgi:outer membrane protein insertion porin family
MKGCRFRRLLGVGFACLLAVPAAANAQQEERLGRRRPSPEEIAVRDEASGWGARLARGRVVVLAQQTRPPQTPSPFEEVPEAPAQQQQQQQPQQTQQQQPPTQQPASPFEQVPEAAPGQQPPSPFEEVTEEQAPSRVGDFIEEIEFRGARRIPRDSLMARVFSKPGDTYDAGALRRDFMVLWNTGYFDDLRLEVEDGERGKIVRFVVVERRVVRTIEYEGNK